MATFERGAGRRTVIVIKPTARLTRMLDRLAAYKAEHGDSSVPKGWADDLRGVSTGRSITSGISRGSSTAASPARNDGGVRGTADGAGLLVGGLKAHPKEVNWVAQLARLAAYKVAHRATATCLMAGPRIRGLPPGSTPSECASGSSTAARHATG
jgi:hypothetical protein